MFTRDCGRRRRGRQNTAGQVLVIVSVGMVALLGIAAVAIDVSSWYLSKRQLQAAVDASALAGAAELPTGGPAAYAAAAANFAKNGDSRDAVIYQNTSTLAPNDTVKVSATRVSPSYFAKVLGIDSVTVKATASATVKSFTRMSSTGQIMPWAVMKSSWTLGTEYPIYTDNSSSNNGAVSLPVKDSSGACIATGGGSDYRDSIVGPAAGGYAACDVSIGDILNVKSGQTTGPTRDGINARITAWEPLSAIVQFTSSGTAVVLDPDNPQLVTLPVVEDLSGGTAWPQGSGQVAVVGFALFVLTEPGYTDGGKTVLGTFVGVQFTNPEWETGAFDPTKNTIYRVELTD